MPRVWHPDRAWFIAEKSIAFGGWRTVDRTARPANTVQVRGATYVSFMDVPFLPLRPKAPIAGLLAATSIDAELMWRIVTQLLLAFFGEPLTAQPVRLLKRWPAGFRPSPLEHPESAISAGQPSLAPHQLHLHV